MGSSEGSGVLPEALLARFRRGCVIPAMPLALDAGRRLDARRQRALIRYTIDAGAGGLAVGVHTTQFAIRDPRVGLFQPVLRLASEAIDEWGHRTGRTILKIAGICGRTPQALQEAAFARRAGYHAGLVSMGAFAAADSITAMVAHCVAVAEVLPIIGFYLQPAVGGRVLPYPFWRSLAEIEGLIGIKVAPFNRYQTLDVVRGVVDAGRDGDVALYTGNDDHIVGDLVTEYALETPKGPRSVRMVGGLLGQWAVWTRAAVALLDEIHTLVDGALPIPAALLARGARLTDANAAIFDAAHGFAGCIPGIHEILRRQGLLAGIWCLDPEETLSPGQMEEIDRVLVAYPELNDDAFVRRHLDRWLE
jgi:dihydrodipicolinate synthase/N-acetylneuraminate lyase